MRLVDRVALNLKQGLADLGFRKRAGQIYTTELTPDVLGWLGLNSATEHQRPGSVEINPIVGVRHQVVERLVAELRGQRFDSVSPPTMNIPIGYVMPEHRYRAWILNTEGPSEEVRDLVTAIADYGLPFMRRAAELHELCRLLAAGTGYKYQLVYRYPVALLVAGEPDRARVELDKSLAEMGARDDPAAIQFRAFADALLQRLAA